MPDCPLQNLVSGNVVQFGFQYTVCIPKLVHGDQPIKKGHRSAPLMLDVDVANLVRNVDADDVLQLEITHFNVVDKLLLG